MTNTAPRETEEAVLDSIRRLLADGQPLRRRSDPPVPGHEKLLLTPALRVETPAVDPPPSAPAAWSLEERIAELEAAMSDRSFEWEPEGSDEADAAQPSRLLFEQRTAQGDAGPRGMAEASARLRLEPPDLVDENDLPRRAAAKARSAPEPEAEDGFDIFADDRLPDPDALRDMVAEIVRAELQSDLGQRVTRNIRKLVRREIRRALTARDFD